MFTRFSSRLQERAFSTEYADSRRMKSESINVNSRHLTGGKVGSLCENVATRKIKTVV